MRPGAVVVAFGIASAFFPSSANADALAASCSEILNVGSSEADAFYYEAEAELGAGKAAELWDVYHRLKHRCAHTPRAKIVVNVEPRVKAFFEARR